MTINARTEGVVKEAIKWGRVVKEVMRERHFDDSETDVGVWGWSYKVFLYTLCQT